MIGVLIPPAFCAVVVALCIAAAHRWGDDS
jgi:hypothetical protein